MPRSHEAHLPKVKWFVIFIWRGCNSQGVVHLWKAHSEATGGEKATSCPILILN